MVFSQGVGALKGNYPSRDPLGLDSFCPFTFSS
jgi:hypothetical protein